jgi:hypothetical protein
MLLQLLLLLLAELLSHLLGLQLLLVLLLGLLLLSLLLGEDESWREMSFLFATPTSPSGFAVLAFALWLGACFPSRAWAKCSY